MKKMIPIMLGLALLSPAALADTYSVPITNDMGDYEMLIRDDGTPVTPTDAYSSILEVTPEGTPDAERLFAAGDAFDPNVDIVPGQALMDANGALLTGFDYSAFGYDGKDSIIFYDTDDNCGAMDAKGQVIVPADYSYITRTETGYLALAKEGETDDEELHALVHIDKDGNVTGTGLHANMLGPCKDGIAVLTGVSEFEYLNLYIDADGAPMFDSRAFTVTFDFEGEFAYCEDNGEAMVIDRKGEQLPLTVSDVMYSNNGSLMLVSEDNGHVSGYDYNDGSLKFEFDAGCNSPSVWDADNGAIGVIVPDGMELYDFDGNHIDAPKDPEVDIVAMYEKGADAVPERFIAHKGEWPLSVAYLVDREGNKVGDDFMELHALCWRDGHGYYLFSRSPLLETSRDERTGDEESVLYGVCDENGEMLLEGVYSNIIMLSTDRFWVTKDDVTSLIDLSGNVLYTVP